MLTKIERFTRWRGLKASEEQNHINSALLFNDYVRSVNTLETIKHDLSSVDAEHYNHFNRFEKRTYGVLLFCKLEIEEAIEQLPEKGITERLLLTELHQILEGIYDNPSHDAVNRLSRVLAVTKQLLEVAPEELTNISRAKTLCFDLYTLLSIVSVGVNHLNWWQKIAVNAVIDLQEAKKEIATLVRMTEKKVQQLDFVMENAVVDISPKEPDILLHSRELLIYSEPIILPEFSLSAGVTLPVEPPEQCVKTLQNHFNEDFLELLKSDSSPESQLTLLEDRINEVSDIFQRLLMKRHKKEAIQLKIEAINLLVKAVNDNDKKMENKEELSILINSHPESYTLLLEHGNALKKAQLIEKLKQLNGVEVNQRLSGQSFQTRNWSLAWVSKAYKTCTPQLIQDVLASALLTRDRECKIKLIELARECIDQFTQEYTAIDREIAKLNSQLSNESVDLEQLIAHESTAHLTSVHRAINATKVAVHEYRRVAEFLKGAVWHLQVIKQSKHVLTEFVQQHNGFLVRLSNFFAQIVSLFKSDTATLIDRALEMKRDLSRFEREYRNELKKEMRAIEKNPDIDSMLKTRLRYDIGQEMRRKTKIIPYTSPTGDEVRHLTQSLAQLFEINGDSVEPYQVPRLHYGP